MNFNFYIYGTPNGYNQYPFDNNSVSLQEFAQSNTTESQLTVCRKGQLVYYAYMRRLQEKTSTFLGFCLVFNGVYCRNPKKLFDLFDRVFYDVQLKGKFLKFDKGKSVYIVDKFAEKLLEIERIKMFFKNNLEDDFTRDFTSIPPAFKFGNGKKNISIKENSIDILTATAEFEVVHIANNEKSLSELERTQKLLTDLYAEKQELDKKYRKLVAQKKQYKVVALLCFVVIVCAAGLFIFNRNLQNKDKQIILQQEILSATKVVHNYIEYDNVYYMSNGRHYHLFKDCRLIDNNAIEGSVKQAFENDIMVLCETCVNRIGEYEKKHNEANTFKRLADDLNDEKYYNSALEWCNKALRMRPDNAKMLELKQQIENRK